MEDVDRLGAAVGGPAGDAPLRTADDVSIASATSSIFQGFSDPRVPDVRLGRRELSKKFKTFIAAHDLALQTNNIDDQIDADDERREAIK